MSVFVGASQPAATPPPEAFLSTFVTFDASSDEASAGASSLEAASAEEAFSEAISASLSDAVDGFFIRFTSKATPNKACL